jgi:predicted helicase
LKLVDQYKYIDGEYFKEKQNWFRDDYVKFIRFAQWKLDNVDEGVIGIITNHTFIDNITFRGMRQSLLSSFDQIYILDLHGSLKKEEIPPEGKLNQNVFDIEQGVAISFFIKRPGLDKKVFFSEFWGSRKEKYQQCIDNTFSSVNWTEIKPTSPNYFLYPRSEKHRKKYDSFWSLTDIFIKHSLPIMSGKDSVTISNSRAEILNTVSDFYTMNIDALKAKFNIGKEKSNWTVAKAKRDIVNTKGDSKYIMKLLYRPFDERYTYYTGNSSGFHSRPGTITQNMLNENLGLLIPRQLSKMNFKHVFCTNKITEMCAISTSTKEANQLFPLYLYTEKEGLYKGYHSNRIINLHPDFISYLNGLYNHKFTPEQIFSYIYGILYSQTYRDKYISHIKIGFPRIPFTNEIEQFEEISKVGNELVKAHLMVSIPSVNNYPYGLFKGEGGNLVDKVIYQENKSSYDEGKVYINKNQYFDNVTIDVWDFFLGGYRVIDKYLKDRKGKALNLFEIENVENAIRIIKFTIEKMKFIDDITKGWI